MFSVGLDRGGEASAVFLQIDSYRFIKEYLYGEKKVCRATSVHSSENPRERHCECLDYSLNCSRCSTGHCRVLPQIVKPPDSIGHATLESTRVYCVWNYFWADWSLEWCEVIAAQRPKEPTFQSWDSHIGYLSFCPSLKISHPKCI